MRQLDSPAASCRSRGLGSVSLGWVAHASMLHASETLEPPMETWGFLLSLWLPPLPSSIFSLIVTSACLGSPPYPWPLPTLPRRALSNLHILSPTVLFLKDGIPSSGLVPIAPPGPALALPPHLCAGDHVRVLICKMLVVGRIHKAPTCHGLS